MTHNLYFALSENDPSSLPLLNDLRKYPFFLFKKDMNKLPIKKNGYEQWNQTSTLKICAQIINYWADCYDSGISIKLK